MVPLAFSWGDLAYLALSFFLVATGFGLLYVFLRVGGTLARLSSLIKGAETEILPVINKVGGTVDRVNAQLEKVDHMTDSAVDAVDSLDTAVRAVSLSITRPVQKVAGFAAGVTYGASSFKSTRDWRRAVQAYKQAAAQRERELAEELREAGGATR
jgi:uncharacterized protein YoxC